jgi:hypothetical protein
MTQVSERATLADDKFGGSLTVPMLAKTWLNALVRHR